MAKKYRSELLRAIHEEALANYEAGAIDKERLFTYEEACLIQEGPIPMETPKDFAVLTLEQGRYSFQTSTPTHSLTPASAPA